MSRFFRAALLGALALRAGGQPPARSPLPAGTAVIRGRVVRSDGRPLPRATVQIAGAERRVQRTETTDADGRFEFTALTADVYTLSARKPGYLELQFGQRRPVDHGRPIALVDGETRDRVDIALPRNGAIAGRVTDENGDAIEGVSVRVLRVAYAADRRLLLEVPSAQARQTNDLGRYRIYGIPPGKYIVAASVGVRGGVAGFAYAPAFFPGGSSPTDAQFVPVDVAQDVSGIDFSTRRVRLFGVSGVANDAAGRPLAGTVMLSVRLDRQPIGIPPAMAVVGGDGAFAFAGVPAGDYVVQAVGRRPPQTRTGMDEGEFAARYLTVIDRDIRDLAMVTSKGSTLRGRIHFDGDASHDVAISAFPTGADVSPNTGGPPAFARARDDGTFEVSGLNGPRRLTLFGGSPQWSIQSIRVNGLNVTDEVLPFGTADQSLDDVDVTVTTHAAEVTGRVVDGRGQPADDYTVIVYSVDRQRWYRNSRFMKFARPQSAGSFRIGGLPPGEYFVAAVDRMEGTEGFGEWQDPSVLESLVPDASRIVLGESQQLSLTPRLIVR